MPAPIMEGAEPFSAPGGPHGVLVVHGFTGNPGSMRSLAQAFAAAGFAVDLPLLPGHGTSIEDMLLTRWDDWSGAAEAAYQGLAARCERVVIAGLSMGGTLTCWLAAHHPEVAGIVCVNPAIEPPAESFVEMIRQTAAAGIDRIPGIGSDIAMPGVSENAYLGTPIEPLLSLLAAQADLADKLGDIRCPVLLLNSPQDHVVPPSSGDFLAERVSGPVERVTLARSFHVATMDFDKDEIEQRSVEFAKKVTAP
ncbi:MAG: carboxylesterase [Acidimicrobiaceae bacterium]|jgi:carboxylesterase|nr:carboxylesterase [Acidimicrobiaceae bacterium]